MIYLRTKKEGERPLPNGGEPYSPSREDVLVYKLPLWNNQIKDYFLWLQNESWVSDWFFKQSWRSITNHGLAIPIYDVPESVPLLTWTMASIFIDFQIPFDRHQLVQNRADGKSWPDAIICVHYLHNWSPGLWNRSPLNRYSFFGTQCHIKHLQNFLHNRMEEGVHSKNKYIVGVPYTVTTNDLFKSEVEYITTTDFLHDYICECSKLLKYIYNWNS